MNVPRPWRLRLTIKLEIAPADPTAADDDPPDSYQLGFVHTDIHHQNDLPELGSR